MDTKINKIEKVRNALRAESSRLLPDEAMG